MGVPARCVAVYIVNKISDVFTATLQAVGGKTDPSSVCEKWILKATFVSTPSPESRSTTGASDTLENAPQQHSNFTGPCFASYVNGQ